LEGPEDRLSDGPGHSWRCGRLQWDYGPGWERPLLDAHGIADDEEQTRCYRVLRTLGD
jgi:kanamycin kinase